MASALALTLSLAAVSAQARDIVMGILPAENNEEMIAKFEPMRAHLEKKLGQKVKLYTATDYSGVIEAMKKKRLDIAWFGALSYYLAEREAGAEAFAVGIGSSGKPTYWGYLLVPADSPAKSLADLRGKSAAFVEPASGSGGLAPTYMVKKASGMTPEQFFGKFTWAGSHDASIMAVKNGTVDVAAAADATYERMIKAGIINADTLRIVARLELPGPPLTYRKDLPSDLKKKIQDAIVNAHNEGVKVSGFGTIARYDAITPADYQPVRDMVNELSLKREQLLK
jgi:phosphonate transport system substrate-binding protein